MKHSQTLAHPTTFWHPLDDGRVQCDVCPRYCKLREGQRGLCYVRGCENGEVVLHSYGRSSGFCVDPIEKKPLNHFLPGTSVLSFGTAGCNLACKFCQNWDMSKSREMDTLQDAAAPENLARTAKRLQCRSVAYTYNDPIIFLEYAVDTAHACRELGINSVAVSAGYISPSAREKFFPYMDAANIDLKAFTDDFYWKICGGHLQPVLETLEYIYHETQVWLEITTLLIPGHNDGEAEIRKMCEWMVEHLSVDVPLHFSAFHPDWKMQHVQSTPATTLLTARAIAMQTGLNYVYTGNVHDAKSGSTYCPTCHARVIERDWYALGAWHIDANACCAYCGTKIAGILEVEPGDWGRRRLPVRIQA